MKQQWNKFKCWLVGHEPIEIENITDIPQYKMCLKCYKYPLFFMHKGVKFIGYPFLNDCYSMYDHIANMIKIIRYIWTRR